MDKNSTYRLLMHLVCHKITGKVPSSDIVCTITPELIPVLYRLSNSLDFAHVVYDSLKELGVEMDEESQKKFKKAQTLAVYRSTKILYDQPCAAELLKSANIPFVLLKGAVIRELYPKSVIRTSCDIDILVPEAEMQKAISLFENNGYVIVANNFHDVAFSSPAGSKVELHFSVCENDAKLDMALKDAWEYTVTDEKGNTKFTDEFFLLHHFTHMAFHFINGGCGIKPIVDLYFIEKQMGLSYENSKELLERAGIYTFAKEMTLLCKAMFEKNELSDEDLVLLSYLIEGGAYGRLDNKVAIKKAEDGGGFMYLLKRFFQPYKDMKDSYPILEKLPVLLPIFWIVRIFHRGIFTSRKKLIGEIANSASTPKEKMQDVKSIREKLGL